MDRNRRSRSSRSNTWEEFENVVANNEMKCNGRSRFHLSSCTPLPASLINNCSKRNDERERKSCKLIVLGLCSALMNDYLLLFWLEFKISSN